MSRYYARQTIVDKNQHLVAFELLFRDGLTNQFPNIEAEVATSRLLANQHFTFSSPLNSTQKPLNFINFPYSSIVNEMPTLLPKHDLVIEILESCTPDNQLLHAVKKLHQEGYRFALDDYIPNPDWVKFYPYISFIKFDIQLLDIKQVEQEIKNLSQWPISFIAEKIETATEFEQCKTCGFDLFQGYFFGEPVVHKSDFDDLNFLPLLKIGHRAADIQMSRRFFEQIIGHDIILSYRFIHFINCMLEPKTPISNFQDALSKIDDELLRQFLILLIFISTTDEDLIHQQYDNALSRGYFCEYIAQDALPMINPTEAFFIGIYSVLVQSLTQKQQEKVWLSPTETKALTFHQGNLGLLLKLCVTYESQQASEYDAVIEKLGLTKHQVKHRYLKATQMITKTDKLKACCQFQ